MADPVVFYVKCKPGDADAWELARKHRIVFVGYPPWKTDPPDQEARSGYRQRLARMSDGIM
jgi:hypothetical protein